MADPAADRIRRRRFGDGGRAGPTRHRHAQRPRISAAGRTCRQPLLQPSRTPAAGGANRSWPSVRGSRSAGPSTWLRTSCCLSLPRARRLSPSSRREMSGASNRWSMASSSWAARRIHLRRWNGSAPFRRFSARSFRPAGGYCCAISRRRSTSASLRLTNTDPRCTSPPARRPMWRRCGRAMRGHGCVRAKRTSMPMRSWTSSSPSSGTTPAKWKRRRRGSFQSSSAGRTCAAICTCTPSTAMAGTVSR